MFHDTYYTGGRSLGYGGASVSVERYRWTFISTTWQLCKGLLGPLQLQWEATTKDRLHTRRCVAKATGQAFAAKRLSAALIVNHPFLMENEHFGLLRATCCNIPRTVRLVDLMGCTAGETVLITE